MTLTLQSPSDGLRGAFTEMAAEFAAHDEPKYAQHTADFTGYLRWLADAAQGRGLAPGRVPVSHFWLVHDGRVLGCSRLRHSLTPELEHEGGHIGYDIRPSERRKGFGAQLLRLTLERAGAMGLSRVRITCDADNTGSIRVIEKNGGLLAGEVPSLTRGKTIRQYWVASTSRPPNNRYLDSSVKRKSKSRR